MKLLVAAILKICTTAHGVHNEEALQTCFDKYTNCTLTMEVIQSEKPEIAALKRLNTCQYNTVL